MDRFEMTVSPRKVLGKKVKTLRLAGLTPANVYGHNVESVALQVETGTLTHALKSLGRNAILSLHIEGEKRRRPVMIRALQRDPVYHKILHVDFYEVSLAEKMRAEVPIVLTGRSAAVDDYGGVLMQSLENVSVEALPEDIPPHYEVDVSVMEELDAAVHVRDLPIDSRVQILNDPDVVVARVAAPRAVIAEEAAEEAAAPVEEAAEEKPPEGEAPAQ